MKIFKISIEVELSQVEAVTSSFDLMKDLETFFRIRDSAKNKSAYNQVNNTKINFLSDTLSYD